MIDYLKPTPWDKRTFHLPTFELTSDKEEALQQTIHKEGHFTLKTDPLTPKEPLRKYGFYYVDTLLEPRCRKEDFLITKRDGTAIAREGSPERAMQIAEQVFVHGRFHRDEQVPSELANLRYKRWLGDLIEQNQIYYLYAYDQSAGFVGYSENKILLLGLDPAFQGKGLAKPFLSLACAKLLESGVEELITSVSAINLASLNLFQTAGFHLVNSIDVYHKLNGKIEAV
ncbi:GNAT family N-acetyltransferase [Halobacillus salinarum]|uniref:GNAT family N-acetyltransferase n=1 Tax=Halobacillus salinarum TaxID=2932257 RepID=A0ABY4EIZ7_9BACI|nr:GNAT family N-acetyltransferase [Halobacillus salinarum]UOQ44022.1 GNAT family N-acetyltransferase [Halobacillus salinarum]